MSSLTSLGRDWITKLFSSCFRLRGSLPCLPVRWRGSGQVGGGFQARDRLVIPVSTLLALTTESGGRVREEAWPWQANQAYWTGRCQGFDVQAADGRHVGMVDHVVYATRIDRPDLVVVAGRRWPHRTRAVPIGGIVEMRPSDRLVVVAMEGGRSAGRVGVGDWARRIAHALPLKERRPT